MAPTTDSAIANLLSSRMKLRDLVQRQVDQIKELTADSSYDDIEEMEAMLTTLETLRERFTNHHNAVTAALPPDDNATKALIEEASQLQKEVALSYQLGADWTANHAAYEEPAAPGEEASQVFEEYTAAQGSASDSDHGTSHAQLSKDDQDSRSGDKLKKAGKSRSDSTRSTSKALDEIRNMLQTQALDFDRMEKEFAHRNSQIDFLQDQRQSERDSFMAQISSLEQELSMMKQRGEASSSTPAPHSTGKSVRWPKSDISSVAPSDEDRERARVAGSRVKSICKTVNVESSNVPLNVTSVPSQSNVPHNASFPNFQSVPTVRGSVSNGVYSRGMGSTQGSDLNVTGDVSLLTSLVCQNNGLMQTYIDETKSHNEIQIDHQQLPRSKIKMFSGDPLDYWMFLKTFDDLVENSVMKDAKKLNALISHCAENVQKLLHGCQLMTSAEGYQKARAILRARFGNPFLISQAWKNKLAGYPKVSTPELLEDYSADLSCCFSTLVEMGHIAELENTDVLSSISSRLDNGLRAKWRKLHRAALKKNEAGKFKDLVDLVSTAAEEVTDPVYNNERLDKLVAGYKSAPLRTRVSPSPPATKTNLSSASYMIEGIDESSSETDQFEMQIQLMATEASTRACHCCGQPHFLSDCPDFLKLQPSERLDLARRKRLCILCLSYGHFIGSCRLKWSCQSPGCVYRHHNLLHGSFPASSAKAKERRPSQAAAVSANQHLIDTTDSGEDVEEHDADVSMNAVVTDTAADIFKTITIRHAILPIAPIVASFSTKKTVIYGLLDPGSTATVCTTRLASKLDLVSKGWAALTINTMTGRTKTRGEVYDMTVQGYHMTESWPVFDMVSLQELPISNAHVAAAEDLKNHSHLAHLEITSMEVKHVDILIGQDNAHLLRPRRTIDGKNLRDPFAVSTPLGWTVYGLKQQRPVVERKEVSLNYLQVREELQPSLEQLVSRSWELDAVPAADTMTAVNRAVVNRWDKELKVVDGYIQLPIPLKRPFPDFPNSRGAVMARLQGLGKRLLKNKELHAKYTKAMLSNIEKGYAVLCTTPAVHGLTCYLTQLPVEHKRKPGEVRPVWNGGFVYKGRSLNDEVHQGPDQTNRITTVMMNFRLYEVAMMGDVRKMYNQVKVPVEQRDLMRFLYWKDGDPNKEVLDYCLTYHMFGGGWSPSACCYALRKIIELAGLDPEGEIALTILRAFYVDDCIKSVIDTVTGIRIFKGVVSTLGQFHFDFAKIISNSTEVTDAFPEERRADRSVDLDFDGGRVCVLHSLGQRWLPDEDVFVFVACFCADPGTRRELLSTLSTLYDPLGLCTPFLIPAKRLLQELTRRGLSWDDVLPEDVREQWGKWVLDAARISQFKVPRWIGLTATDQQFWLVHFSDASEVAYGTVCYICIVDQDNVIQSSNLLTSRYKLAPLKTQSIPRLELCAAVLGAQLDESVREFLEVQPTRSVFWSDSTLVLRYINSEPRNFKTFIANRVSAIQEVTQPAQWRHVPGILNPADMLSRGISVDELISSRMWLHGPDYLMKSREEWPPQPDFVATEFPENEIKKTATIYSTQVTQTDEIEQPLAEEDEESKEGIVSTVLDQSSCWRTLVDRLSWIAMCARIWKYTVLEKKKDRVHSGFPTLQDTTVATRAVIRATQDLYLGDKETKSKTFQRLFPRLRHGMLCVGGRLERSTFPTEFKQPYILPAGNKASDLFITHCHNEVFHSGIERTLMEVRKTAWLLTGRKGVSLVLKKCRVCKKYKSKPMTQVMADLPPYRLKMGERPFSYIGLDFMGPLSIKIGRSTQKRYICVVVCSVTRAIHLEVAVDLSTSGFLNAFNRFVARRGKPRRVLSDNGTNFVGAKSELARETVFWNKNTAAKRCRDKGIEWSFNPPAASHFGGMWERHIRSIRSLMLCEVEGHTLSDDGLHTLICLIEQCLNSRPLTRMSDDPSDMSPLTPNHILIGDKVNVVKGVFFKNDVLRKTWKQAQHLADCFWKRWSTQYLVDLQQRTKWVERQENLKVGALVLIVQETLPRPSWPLGLVIKVYPGTDGFVRAADVRTAEGTYTRPIVKLVLLEADLDIG